MEPNISIIPDAALSCRQDMERSKRDKLGRMFIAILSKDNHRLAQEMQSLPIENDCNKDMTPIVDMLLMNLRGTEYKDAIQKLHWFGFDAVSMLEAALVTDNEDAAKMLLQAGASVQRAAYLHISIRQKYSKLLLENGYPKEDMMLNHPYINNLR